MGFPLTDLIIEGVIRDGFENLRRMPEIIDDLFSQLTSLPPSLANKYGQKEINKLKELVTKTEVAIIQSFPTQNSIMPCISIQLLSAKEEIPLTVMDDYEEEVQTPMTPQELAAQIYTSNISIISYDPFSGIVLLADSADLSRVYPNLLFVDAAGNQFPILGGINNTPGSKQIIIQKQASILDTMGPALIKSSINYNEFQIRTNVEQESLLLGVHSKDALTTKYLYTIVKYFIESRKADLITRGFMLATYEGSDFNVNEKYESNFIYDRFLTVSGKIYNTWNSDQVIPIDSIDISIKVEKDIADTEDLGLQNSTIQVGPDKQED